MKTVGIKLADGSFYPIMEEGTAQQKKLNLTTAHNNQTCVMVDMYRSKTCSMEDAEYIDTLKIENLVAHPNGEPNISFSVGLDENGELSAKIEDPETGAESDSNITLISRTLEERLVPDEYTIDENAITADEVSTDTTEEVSLDEFMTDEEVVTDEAEPTIEETAVSEEEVTFDDIPVEEAVEPVAEEPVVEE